MATYEGTATAGYPAFDGVSNLAQTCLVAQSLGTGGNSAYSGYFYSAGAHAIFANVNGTYGAAVYATNLDDGNTIVAYGSGDGYATIYGQNESEGGIGVYGRCEEDTGIGVYGKADNGTGVHGESDYFGVHALGNIAGAVGVATANYGMGVWASDGGAAHMQALVAASYGAQSVGVFASASGTGSWAASFEIGSTSSGAYAAGFDGLVYVDGPLDVVEDVTLADVLVGGDAYVYGVLHKSGGGFRIDHPLDPLNRYLDHSFVECPEMKNFYDGIGVADENGELHVAMPKYFHALNHKFRYLLTSIGQPGPGLHIKGELADGSFAIGGATPGQKISWAVTGVRQDAWAIANRIVPEHAKPAEKTRFRRSDKQPAAQPIRDAALKELTRSPEFRNVHVPAYSNPPKGKSGA